MFDMRMEKSKIQRHHYYVKNYKIYFFFFFFFFDRAREKEWEQNLYLSLLSRWLFFQKILGKS